MKIYGKTFGEIFADIPWQYKIVIVVGSVFIVFSVLYTTYFMFSGVNTATKKVEPIRIPGIAAKGGLLDPSIATDGEIYFMVHTLLGTQKTSQGISFVDANIRLAKSVSSCKRWFALPQEVFAAAPEEVVGPDATTPLDPPGLWRYETPTIAYDPDDKGREWKIYAHKYFWNGNEGLARLYSFIVYKTLNADGIDWSSEEIALTASATNPPPPYGMLPSQKVNDLDPSLRGTYFYSRPSVAYVGGVLFMTLSAYAGLDSHYTDKVVMLASTDHGKTWRYINTLLTTADAAGIGPYTLLNGAELLKNGNQLYVAAVFGNDKSDGLGTFVIPFADVVKGQLQRDEKTGAPVVMHFLPNNSAAPSKIGGGYAAYADNCELGMLVSEFSGTLRSFEIFKTYKTPTGKE